LAILNLEQAVPFDYQVEPGQQETVYQGALPGAEHTEYTSEEQKIIKYVIDWRDQLKKDRQDKQAVWDECWQLYRGLEDWSSKEEWQTKIVIPKAFSSVKQATNVIKRLLSTSKKPWTLESINPDDLITVARAEQMGELTKVFLEQAKFIEEFAEALECSFITGVGIMKCWWGFETRQKVGVEQNPLMDEYGQQSIQKQIVRREILEGRLFVRAVDPYNFYWLPGSKMNRWTGTLEEIEIPHWQLIDLADKGVFPKDKIKKLKGKTLDDNTTRKYLRFNERQATGKGPSTDTANDVLTEFYGPIVIDGEIIRKNAHVVIANDTCLLVNGDNALWSKKSPHIGFSPLSLPFRTEGVGLIEMVRAIDKALSKLANLSVDTLLFRLLPIFEVAPEVYENGEDLETGMHPGKVLRRTLGHAQLPGIRPVPFEDVSQGSVAVSAQLDRAHQEGALVSEIQQALPRYRGAMTAEEISTKSDNQDSFFGSMAADLEKQAIEPLVELAADLIFQFIDTVGDPRIARILGIGADTLRGIPREELMEMIQGDWIIKVSGISDQLDKVEMLQNLIQMMNLIGQNPEAWLPYINQDKLLQRILEAFRPAIHDINNIIADPETVISNRAAIQGEQITPELLRMIPQLVQMATAAKQAQEQSALQAAQIEMQKAQIQAQKASTPQKA
jgi:hypothetical protein